MYLFFFRLTILVALLSATRVYAEITTDIPQALTGCHDLGATTVELPLSQFMTLLIGADPDPKGYCLIGLRNSAPSVKAPVKAPVNESSSAGDAAETPPTPQVPEDTEAGGQDSQPIPSHMCPLSKSDVDVLSTPGIAGDLTNTANFAPDTQLSPDVQATINKVVKCLDQAPKDKPPTPVEPPKPSGVPGGTLLPLPPGVVAAPGTTPPGTPPGMIQTPVAPAPGVGANSNAIPANTTNQSK